MVYLASNRHYKRLHSIIFAFDNEPGKDNSMCALDAKVAWPELRGLEIGSVNDKLVCIGVQCASCLHA